MKWKSVVSLAAVALGVLVLALLGFRLFVAEPPPPPAPVEVEVEVAVVPQPPAVPAPAPDAVVVRVEGEVEQSRGGGTWRRLVEGDRLVVGEALRTGRASTAELQVGDGTRLTASAQTELSVRGLSAGQQRFQLQRGRVSAVVDPGTGRTVRIENEAGAVVETTAARFAVMSSGQVLAVATETGGVTLSAAGKQVTVAPGEAALSEAGAAPLQVGPLPRALVLKLAQARQVDAGLCAVVQGVAPRGAEVRVDGEVVGLDAAGRFRLVVPRREGRSQVRVATRDLLGRTREELVACAEEREAKVSRLKVNWAAPP